MKSTSTVRHCLCCIQSGGVEVKGAAGGGVTVSCVRHQPPTFTPTDHFESPIILMCNVFEMQVRVCVCGGGEVPEDDLQGEQGKKASGR